MGGFEQAGAQLAGVEQQQTDLQRAVAAGELWMEAGVAEAAARRCFLAVDEIDEWLNGTERLADRCKFGENKDGGAAAVRFTQAGQDYLSAVRNAQQVLRRMAETFLAAGRTAAEADGASEQQFRSGSE